MSKAKQPITPQELYKKGLKLYDEAEFVESIQYLQKCIPTFQQQKIWHKTIKAQDTIACCYMLLGKLQQALPILLQNVKEAKKRLGETHLLTSNAYNSLGYCYGEQGDYDLQLEHYQKALAILQQEHGEIHEQVATCYNNIGYSYSEKGAYKKGLNYTLKALDIRLQLHGELHPLTAQSYNNVGYIYSVELGDNDKGLLYYQKALHVRQQILPSNHPSIGVSYGNIAGCFERQEKYQKSLEYKQKSLQIDLDRFGENHPNVALDYNNIGYTYKLMGDTNKALQYTNRGLQIRLKTLGENHPLTAMSYMNVGLMFGEINEKKWEIDYLQKANQLQKQILGQKHPSVALSNINLGKAYGKSKQPLRQLNFLQQALHILLEDYGETDIYCLPPLEGYSDSNLLLEALGQKAFAFRKLFKTFKQVKDLQASVAHFQAALQLLNQIRNSYKADGSKLLLAQKNQGLFEQMMEASVLLFHYLQDAATLQSAFTACEQSKAALLLSNFKEIEAKTAANIPSNLLQKEQLLKVELSYLDKSMAKLKTKGAKNDDVLYGKFQNQYFDYKRQYDALIEQFEQNYPAYFQLKYNTQLAQLEEIQLFLSKQKIPTTLIAYFIGGENIYIFTSNATHSFVKQIPKPEAFNDWITDLQDAIQLIDLEDFVAISHQLYACLIAPIEAQIGESEKLIILRHDVLEYLPFEVLLSQELLASSNPTFAELPYLLKDFEISYHYSATLLLNGISKSILTEKQENTFLGLAPVTFNGEERVELAMECKRGKHKILRSNRAGEEALQQLPNTETEVKEVYHLFQSKEWDAKAFLFGSASKENLLAEAPNHKFILISTHGFMEGEDSGLSGIYLADVREKDSGDRGEGSKMKGHQTPKNQTHRNPNTQTHRNPNTQTHRNPNTQTHRNPNTDFLLYTSDAYHLQLNADLVVLSSCSSGIGKLQKGEGMMAMNRGFLSAGASNIIFTQFDIPDQSSSKLVKALFQYILEEKSYAAALRQAKLEVMQQEGSSVQDWAGFVLIGG